MRYALLLSALLLTACDAGSSPNSNQKSTLGYQELVDYPVDCSKKEQQLEELIRIQKIKNFSQDPDDLNDADRAYNSRLKATIWWFRYRCEK